MFEKITARLRRPISNAFLTVFRVFFGIWMVIRCLWYIVSQDVRYVEHTQILFAYRGWEWVPHVPTDWFIVLMWISMFSAIGITFGIFTRVFALIFLMTFGYFFIVDAATWGNMDYLFSLLAFILLLVPSGARFSWDAWRKGSHSDSVPAWILCLLRFQIGAVYFYAGLIKCTPDWLLRASPIDIFLSTENKISVLQPLFENPIVVHAFAFGGCFFDLFIVPLLLWKRSRRWAMALVVFFHTFNMVVLGLGNVTVFMLLATLLVFSEPDFLESFVSRLERSLKTVVGSASRPSFVAFVAAAFVVVQALIPLRHLAYSGDARWNGDGQNFSWWMRSIHMKVDSKFYAEYDGKRVRLDPLKTIAKEQSAMGKDPDMMAQYARFVAAGLRAEGHQNVKVMVESTASLNGRPAQRFIRENVDLGALPPGFVPADIVVPLD
jgi:vitamin K-dependent gamma-carboxylase